MSTKFTRTSPLAGYDLVESNSLDVLIGLGAFRDTVLNWLVRSLSEHGFKSLSASQLGFLGALDCGPNHAAKLARDLGISRQAVHKITKDMVANGWLEMLPDPDFGNRKAIQFTSEGERMMSLSRSLFLELDAKIEATCGSEVWGVLEKLRTLTLGDD